MDGVTYLVAARGNTQWVRNLRAAGEGELHHGSQATPFHGEEIPDQDKLPILKTYLDKWAWEVGAFFELPEEPLGRATSSASPPSTRSSGSSSPTPRASSDGERRAQPSRSTATGSAVSPHSVRSSE